MPYYYYVIIIVPFFVFLLVRFFLRKKRSISDELFVEGLRNENDGLFEEAVINYENALKQFTKEQSHNIVKRKIIEKLKLLHIVIEYKKSIHFVRE